MADLSPLNARALQIARGWIGTPYRHRAARRGVGADCLGLVRGVWCALYGGAGPDVPPYAPDWSEAAGREPLWAALRTHLVETARAGDGQVLLFRLGPNAMAKHLGVQSRGGGAFIHACPRAGVVEAPLSAPWARRIVARFDFPALPTG
ncbi:peptidase [Roseinatronobacter sp. NSM]|uniref:peptidase n=1 Tax=Roseinatronobacter sp. NSM TaxID=3457785 RepID=UPI0040365176